MVNTLINSAKMSLFILKPASYSLTQFNVQELIAYSYHYAQPLGAIPLQPYLIVFEGHNHTSNKILNPWNNIHINGIVSDYIYEEKYRNGNYIQKKKTMVVDLEHCDAHQVYNRLSSTGHQIEDELSNIKCAVFGLGNSQYELFDSKNDLLIVYYRADKMINKFNIISICPKHPIRIHIIHFHRLFQLEIYFYGLYI